MSALPSPHSTSPSMRASALPFTGTVSVWPARITRVGAAELGAGDEVGADPLDLEVRQGAQPRLEVVDERPPRRGSPTGSPPASAVRGEQVGVRPWRTR